jgi:uncharacterized membrane protein YphA (DoxX/SURF4 family)
MIRIVFGVFFLLHGLVHLLYFGQSARYFELQPGMAWPDGAWALSRFFGAASLRTAASVLLVVAAAGFIAGGAAIFLSQAGWRFIVIGAALFSTIIYIIFWNGSLQKLDNQGVIGILINLGILAALLIFRWPNFAF